MDKILKKPELVFIIYALIFGFILLFKVLPIQSVLDGGDHFRRAVEVSHGIMFATDKNSWVAGYSPVLYFASALGFKIFQAFHAGRIFNLLVWIILIASAIKITPVFKWLFVFTALMPASLFLGMTYSADSFSNAFSFLFFAYLFRLIYGSKEFSYLKNCTILTIFTTIGAFCKGALAPLLLIPLIKIKKYKYLILSILAFLGISLLGLWSSINHGTIPDTVNPALNKSFILHNPLSYLYILFKTIITSIPGWAYGCIGFIGWVLMEKNLIVFSLIMYIASLFFIPAEVEIKLAQRLWAFVILLLYTIMTCTLLFFIYTPYGSNEIYGVQPRYFIQVIPLLFIILSAGKLPPPRFTNSFIKIMLIFLFVLLSYSCYIAI